MLRKEHTELRQKKKKKKKNFQFITEARTKKKKKTAENLARIANRFITLFPVYIWSS
jgi:hypothetical protein